MTLAGSRTAAGLAAALVGSVLVAGCGTDQAAADAVLEASSDSVDGTATTFTVPTGRLQVTVGTPLDQVSSDDLADGGDQSAPDGSSLLPVGVEFTYPEGAPWGGRLAVDPQEADVRITVDGETRDLGSPYTAGGRALSGSASEGYYVVVPGEPDASKVTVEVTYDGATQSAPANGDPSGAAAALAELPADAPSGADCPQTWSPASEPLQVECTISLVGRTPYWPGSGWAPDGSEWVVIGVDRLQVYPADDADEVASVEGTGAAAQLQHGDLGETGLSGVIVLDSGDVDGSSVPLEVTVASQTPTADQTSTLTYDVPVPD